MFPAPLGSALESTLRGTLAFSCAHIPTLFPTEGGLRDLHSSAGLLGISRIGTQNVFGQLTSLSTDRRDPAGVLFVCHDGVVSGVGRKQSKIPSVSSLTSKTYAFRKLPQR